MTNIATLLKPLATTAATVAAGMMILQPTPASAVVFTGPFTNGDFSSGLSNWHPSGSVEVSTQNGETTANLQLFGSIYQEFSTVPGSTYQVSFDVLNTSQDFSNYHVSTYEFSSSLSRLTSTPNGQFNHYSFDFTANYNTDILAFDYFFDETGPVKSFGPVSAPGANTFSIANISVSAAPSTAVPEPFTIIGTLVGGTAALRMKKKLKVTVPKD